MIIPPSNPACCPAVSAGSIRLLLFSSHTSSHLVSAKRSCSRVQGPGACSGPPSLTHRRGVSPSTYEAGEDRTLTSGVGYGLTRRGGHRRQKPCCCLRIWKQVSGRPARPGIQHVAHVAEGMRVPGGISHRADVTAVQEQAAHEGGLAAGRSLLRQRCLRPQVIYLWIMVYLARTQCGSSRTGGCSPGSRKLVSTPSSSHLCSCTHRFASVSVNQARSQSHPGRAAPRRERRQRYWRANPAPARQL